MLELTDQRLLARELRSPNSSSLPSNYLASSQRSQNSSQNALRFRTASLSGLVRHNSFPCSVHMIRLGKLMIGPFLVKYL
jgi:hypothetical protein